MLDGGLVGAAEEQLREASAGQHAGRVPGGQDGRLHLRAGVAIAQRAGGPAADSDGLAHRLAVGVGGVVEGRVGEQGEDGLQLGRVGAADGLQRPGGVALGFRVGVGELLRQVGDELFFVGQRGALGFERQGFVGRLKDQLGGEFADGLVLVVESGPEQLVGVGGAPDLEAEQNLEFGVGGLGVAPGELLGLEGFVFAEVCEEGVDGEVGAAGVEDAKLCPGGCVHQRKLALRRPAPVLSLRSG